MMETTFSESLFFSKMTDVLLGQYCSPYSTPTTDFFTVTLVKFQLPSSTLITGLYASYWNTFLFQLGLYDIVPKGSHRV